MASEQRLIDANELLELYDMGTEFEEYAKALSVPVPVIRQNIKDMPTVDAEEVVRCKDCKFFHDKGYCILVTGLTRIKPEDDFCSHGERNDNDQS